MAVALRIQLEEVDQKVILRLEGRIDASSSPILEKKIDQLIADKYHYLLLDFTQIDYLSSAGMRVLLSATKKLKSKKGGLVLFALGDEIAAIVKMAGFDRILPIYSNEKEALRQMNAMEH